MTKKRKNPSTMICEVCGLVMPYGHGIKLAHYRKRHSQQVQIETKKIKSGNRFITKLYCKKCGKQFNYRDSARHINCASSPEYDHAYVRDPIPLNGAKDVSGIAQLECIAKAILQLVEDVRNSRVAESNVKALERENKELKDKIARAQVVFGD